MSAILRDVAALYPEATADEISNALICFVQSAVADAVRHFKLPPPKTPVEIAMERFRLRRFRSFNREFFEEQKVSHEKLITELFDLQSLLDGHAESTPSIPEGLGWIPGTSSDSITHFVDGYPSPTKSPAELRQFDLNTEPLVLSRQKTLPYSPWSSELLKAPDLRYQEDFVYRLSDPVYERVASTLEVSLREFAEKVGFEWKFSMSEQSDLELPTWKRFVLQISISAKDFDERLRLWDELDKAVRKRISELAEEYPDERAKIFEFEKLLFLRLEMT